MDNEAKAAKQQRAEDRAATQEQAAADAVQAAADHHAKMERDAVAKKADISEHAAGARADISDAEAAARAEVDAKVEEARPEEEKVSPEQIHHLRMARLGGIRDQALQASRRMDIFALGHAVHDMADLLHDFLDEHRPDPMAEELVGHYRAPVRK